MFSSSRSPCLQIGHVFFGSRRSLGRASPFRILPRLGSRQVDCHPIVGICGPSTFPYRSGLPTSNGQWPTRRVLRPLLTSDKRSVDPYEPRSPSYALEQSVRPPEVSSTNFHARPPNLRSVPLMDMDFAVICQLVRHSRLYPVLVHRPALLPPASFRQRFATMPLPLAYPSPPSGWVEELHLHSVEHARHTKGSLGWQSEAFPHGFPPHPSLSHHPIPSPHNNPYPFSMDTCTYKYTSGNSG